MCVRRGVLAAGTERRSFVRTNKVYSEKKAESSVYSDTCLASKIMIIVGAWTPKRLYDMCWTDSKRCQCCQAEGTEKHRLYQGYELREEKNNMSDKVRSCDLKAKSSKEDGKWQRRLSSCPKLGKERRSSKYWEQQWHSDTSRDLDGKVDGFREHLAIDGSMKEVQDGTRHVLGRWCNLTTTKGPVVGGTESSENDQKSGVTGPSPWFCQV